jgi:hypothetical protein
MPHVLHGIMPVYAVMLFLCVECLTGCGGSGTAPPTPSGPATAPSAAKPDSPAASIAKLKEVRDKQQRILDDLVQAKSRLLSQLEDAGVTPTSDLSHNPDLQDRVRELKQTVEAIDKVQKKIAKCDRLLASAKRAIQNKELGRKVNSAEDDATVAEVSEMVGGLTDDDAPQRVADFDLKDVLKSELEKQKAPLGGTPSATAPRPKTPDGERLLDLPNDAQQAKALPQVEEIYKADRERATSNTEKERLAEKVFEVGKGTNGNDVARFVLLNYANDVAIEATSLKLVDVIVGEIESHYNVGRTAFRAESMRRLAKITRSEADFSELTRRFTDLAEQAEQADDYEAAATLGAYAIAAASRSEIRETCDVLRLNRERVLEVKNAFDGTVKHRDQLLRDPSDAGANLEMGRFYCFYKGDWEKGLPLLRWGKDAELKSLVDSESKRPTGGANCLAIADAWWMIAQHLEGVAQENVKAHASSWYVKCVDAVNGLDKARAEKRFVSVPLKASAYIDSLLRTHVQIAAKPPSAEPTPPPKPLVPPVASPVSNEPKTSGEPPKKRGFKQELLEAVAPGRRYAGTRVPDENKEGIERLHLQFTGLDDFLIEAEVGSPDPGLRMKVKFSGKLIFDPDPDKKDGFRYNIVLKREGGDSIARFWTSAGCTIKLRMDADGGLSGIGGVPGFSDSLSKITLMPYTDEPKTSDATSKQRGLKEELLEAVAPGKRYVGTRVPEGDKERTEHLHLQFTGLDDFLIDAEVGSPDPGVRTKVKFSGKLILDPDPDKKDGFRYNIVLKREGGDRWARFWTCEDCTIKLRMDADGGLSGIGGVPGFSDTLSKITVSLKGEEKKREKKK